MIKQKTNTSELYTGPILKKMALFAIPLILTGVLQLLYNAADMMVVGQFAGKEALSAVGATSALINIFINIFIGLALGASVVTSRCYGANDPEGVSETVHTAIALSIVGGIFLTIAGIIFSKPLLVLMGTPDDILDLSALYLKIFFSGMTFNMVYNYGASILRAVGDTKRPLIFLTVSGIVNVVLNLILVIIFNMGVAGVGFATIASQAVSMVMVVHCLVKSDSVIKLDFKKLKFHKDKLIMLVKFGLPAGLQSLLFSLSNALIQSSINLFGTTVIAGNTASSNIEGFFFVSVNAFNQSNITFVSQNIGAGQYTRVKKCFAYSLILALIGCISISAIFITFAEPLVSLYNSDPEVIEIAAMRLVFMSTFQFFCVFMQIGAGQLQAMGRSFLAMIVTLFGACILRVVWIYTFFAANPTIMNVYISYPATWCITATIQVTLSIYFMGKLPKADAPLPSREPVSA